MEQSKEGVRKDGRRVISLRMSGSQVGYLESLQRRVQAMTGTKVTRTSLMMRLMHLGFEQMEAKLKQYEEKRSA